MDRRGAGVLETGGAIWWPAAIVVLPFANLSNDPDQEYFADGISDDLTTDLSRISGSFVIAHNTALTYKGKPVDVKQVGRELGVRYVLEGSVRRAGDQVQVNAQLVDAETGAHLWADRFDIDRRNFPQAQNEITAVSRGHSTSSWGKLWAAGSSRKRWSTPMPATSSCPGGPCSTDPSP